MIVASTLTVDHSGVYRNAYRLQTSAKPEEMTYFVHLIGQKLSVNMRVRY